MKHLITAILILFFLALPAHAAEFTAPAVPELTVEVKDMAAVLTWTGGDEADLAGYRIYRAAGEGGARAIRLVRPAFAPPTRAAAHAQSEPSRPRHSQDGLAPYPPAPIC